MAVAEGSESYVRHTADIVASYVTKNSVAPAAVPHLIENVYGVLSSLGRPSAVAETSEPAVPVRLSIKRGHLVCLEDGKKLKVLKRHLMTDHGMTPAQYRERWKLPANYPMVAPDYADTRRALAVEIGLGRKRAKNPAQVSDALAVADSDA